MSKLFKIEKVYENTLSHYIEIYVWYVKANNIDEFKLFENSKQFTYKFTELPESESNKHRFDDFTNWVSQLKDLSNKQNKVKVLKGEIEFLHNETDKVRERQFKEFTTIYHLYPCDKCHKQVTYETKHSKYVWSCTNDISGGDNLLVWSCQK